MHQHPDFASAIGRTPLLRLRHASQITGCEVLAKAELMNPGGSIKDRTALGLLQDARDRQLIRPGGIIVEGTAGNTGIGLGLLGASLGYRTVIFMPDTQARAHAQALNAADPGSAWFANQFDNTANRDFHEATTGAEIWEQTQGCVDGFVCASGTGGTLAGVGRALKARKPGVRIALADPAGSALANYVQTGELVASGNSISEGIGSSRVTANFDGAPIDLAWSIPDDESIPLAHRLLHDEGWCVGGSSGVNVAGAIRLARELGPGHTVVTILCDAGTRYQAKLFNPRFLRDKNIPVPAWLDAAFPEA
jgi:cysteine synthase A